MRPASIASVVALQAFAVAAVFAADSDHPVIVDVPHEQQITSTIGSPAFARSPDRTSTESSR